jgi:hypothetical protein
MEVDSWSYESGESLGIKAEKRMCKHPFITVAREFEAILWLKMAKKMEMARFFLKVEEYFFHLTRCSGDLKDFYQKAVEVGVKKDGGSEKRTK